MEGTTIDGKYEIVRELGRGGMGAVYLATHRGTGRRVALKVLVPESLGSGDVLARFRREARASGAIDSQHVVQVLDTGVDPASGSPYLVMELLQGEDVASLVERRGALPPELALRIVAQGAVGLARAHEQGVLHRDIKPANLFLARRDGGEVVVKVLDFGIAKLRPDILPETHRDPLTRTGSLLGSPLYMSPEQITGSRGLDARSDVYALGVTLYELLAGVTPHHEATTLGQLVLQICGGGGVPLEQRVPSLPEAVRRLVACATATDPDARFATIGAVQSAIAALLPAGAALTEASLVASPPAPALVPATVLLDGGPAPPPVATARMVTAPAPAPSRPAPSAPSAPALAAASVDTIAGLPSRRAPSRAPMVVGALGLLAVGATAFAMVGRGPRRTLPAEARVAVASEVPASASASAPASVSASAPASASASAPASASASAPGTEPSTVLSAPSAAGRPPKPRTKPRRSVSCDPDYYFDAEGVKHFKEECMK